MGCLCTSGRVFACESTSFSVPKSPSFHRTSSSTHNRSGTLTRRVWVDELAHDSIPTTSHQMPNLLCKRNPSQFTQCCEHFFKPSPHLMRVTTCLGPDNTVNVLYIQFVNYLAHRPFCNVRIFDLYYSPHLLFEPH
ncbi:unnamed protein product [Protopolystoma xenopodis]|uniref:Uncharacterized protein n=1 Tax=Protopolystoma xenopodis TaxID=117903 RepID=A0A3S5AFX5_9PLAT|nr:unnamed protein product [Protopolystoma xenopodis]